MSAMDMSRLRYFPRFLVSLIAARLHPQLIQECSCVFLRRKIQNMLRNVDIWSDMIIMQFCPQLKYISNSHCKRSCNNTFLGTSD